jgi:hypothetical protein
MRMGSMVRSAKRRTRCVRRGHDWVHRLNGRLEEQVFCRRCGRLARGITPFGRYVA